MVHASLWILSDMSNAELRVILKNHIARYPQIQAQDIYKLLHQAALGSEHAVQNEQEARAWLERELAEIGAGPDDLLFDPISPDGQIVRVHLRPYVAAGRDPGSLLRAFIHTANDRHGSLDKLKEYGEIAARLKDAGPLSFSGEAIRSFFATMEGQGFPAVHH